MNGYLRQFITYCILYEGSSKHKRRQILTSPTIGMFCREKLPQQDNHSLIGEAALPMTERPAIDADLTDDDQQRLAVPTVL